MRWLHNVKIPLAALARYIRYRAKRKIKAQSREKRLFTGAPNDNFRENFCSEDDLRSRIFGTFVVKFFFFFFFYFFIFYFIITLGIHLQYSYTVLTYNKTTKFTYVTALLLTCLLLTYIKIPKTSLQQTKGLLKTINK